LQRGKEHASYVLHWEEGVNKKDEIGVGLDLLGLARERKESFPDLLEN
jgi:hypothetical protein